MISVQELVIIFYFVGLINEMKQNTCWKFPEERKVASFAMSAVWNKHGGFVMLSKTASVDDRRHVTRFHWFCSLALPEHVGSPGAWPFSPFNTVLQKSGCVDGHVGKKVGNFSLHPHHSGHIVLIAIVQCPEEAHVLKKNFTIHPASCIHIFSRMFRNCFEVCLLTGVHGKQGK
jgi:hypothetical protein